VRGVQEILDKTVEVKLEYEEVIRELLISAGNEVRDLVIQICMKKRQEKESGD